MRSAIVLTVFILFLFSAPSGAEYYMYFDANGIAHFTNEYYNIPKALRDSAREYVEYEYRTPKPPSGNAVPETRTAEDKAVQPAPPANNKKDLSGITDKEYLRLTKTKQEVDAEYEKLKKETDLIQAEKDKAEQTPEKISETNEKIMKMNEQIDNYTKKRAVLDAEVTAYNAKLKSDLEQKTAEEAISNNQGTSSPEKPAAN